MAKVRTGGMGLQRSNSQGSPNYSRDKGSGIEHQSRGHFQPSPDRQNSWNRSPRPDTSYTQNLDARPPMVNYNERQPLAFQSPHHEFVSGMRPMQQQPPHVSPQRAPAPPQWAPSSGPVHHMDVPQLHQGQSPCVCLVLRQIVSSAGPFQYPVGMCCRLQSIYVFLVHQFLWKSHSCRL